MTDYELTFITDALDESQIEPLFSEFDCVTGETHAGDEFITITAIGDTAVEAAKTMQTRLATFGVLVRRLEPDLVTRREIAERLEVEPQAVGMWVRGERFKGFPKAFHDVANGIWLWGDVVSWCRSVRDIDPADGLDFPTREDHSEVNACFDRQYREVLSTTNEVYTFVLQLHRNDARASNEIHWPPFGLEASRSDAWAAVRQQPALSGTPND